MNVKTRDEAERGDAEYLTKEEVAVRLRRPVATILDWMSQGKIPFYRIERAIRFRWSEVQEFFAAEYRVAAKGGKGKGQKRKGKADLTA